MPAVEVQGVWVGGDDGGAEAGLEEPAGEVVVFLSVALEAFVEAVDGEEGLECDAEVGAEDLGLVGLDEDAAERAEGAEQAVALGAAVFAAEGCELGGRGLGDRLGGAGVGFEHVVGLLFGEFDSACDDEVGGCSRGGDGGLVCGEDGGGWEHVAVEEDQERVGVWRGLSAREGANGVVADLAGAGDAGVRALDEGDGEVEVGRGCAGHGLDFRNDAVGGEDGVIGLAGLRREAEEGPAEVARGVGADDGGEIGHGERGCLVVLWNGGAVEGGGGPRNGSVWQSVRDVRAAQSAH